MEEMNSEWNNWFLCNFVPALSKMFAFSLHITNASAETKNYQIWHVKNKENDIATFWYFIIPVTVETSVPYG